MNGPENPCSREEVKSLHSVLYAEARSHFDAVYQPSTGQISDATEIHVSPDGKQAVFAGTIVDRLEGTPPTRICLTDLDSGATHVLTFGPNVDRLPKLSPSGDKLAFLSDRRRAGDFQLYLLDPSTGVARPTPSVDGWVEYLHWSPDGNRIVLGVAGHGADIAGGQGAVTSRRVAESLPSWMPTVQTGDETHHWRYAWIYDLKANQMRRCGPSDVNIWEVVWCGNDRLAAIASPGPSEGLWYSARLHIIELDTGRSQEIYRPEAQLGWPVASPSGAHLVVVEAVCSDRWFVAGDLQIIDATSGKVRRLDTRGVDISYTEWRSDQRLLLAGHRGLESVVGLYDVPCNQLTELWVSREITTGGFHIVVSGFGEAGDCGLIGEGFTRAPEIAVIRRGTYRTVKSFNLGYAECAEVIEAADPMSWSAPDGLEIQGWLLRPRAGRRPYPLIACIHGGPVGQWRPRCLGRVGFGAFQLMVLKRGYAIFFPNPRGSSGRGQSFARLVRGDLGGAETADHLSGLDYLVSQGLADPARLGVTGVSHGGFMTSWLVTQSERFAAAVAVAPVTNFVTEYLISNIPGFVSVFLADSYTNPNGKYVQRSPVMHAHKTKTPTLNICGALDRCTPPEEALQFHNALRENGVESVLVTYPEEGHGVRKWPAAFDYAARVVAWFEGHLGRKA